MSCTYCLWRALVQYVLYLLFVACPGTICLVLIVCGVPWYSMSCTYCLWRALVQYVLYVLFVACPGTICLVRIVCGVPWYNMSCTYCFISSCNFFFILKVFYRWFSVLLNTSVHCTGQEFCSLYCLIRLVQLNCSIPLFSYTAQYFCSFILLNNFVHLYSSALFACAQFVCIAVLWFVCFNQTAHCQPTKGAKGSVCRTN